MMFLSWPVTTYVVLAKGERGEEVGKLKRSAAARPPRNSDGWIRG
jgi:hypothetical protein